MERLILPPDIVQEIHQAPFGKVVDLWQAIIEEFGKRGKAALGRCDRFYLLTVLLHRPDAIHPWLYARCREVEANPDDYLDLWARFHYKAVDVNEPVPTPDGWKAHGDLLPGDSVFGSDGMPYRVIAKTEVFTDADCYRVTFDDRYSVVVSGDHLWPIRKKHRHRQAGTNIRQISYGIENIPTRDIRKGQDVGVAAPLILPESNLPLDPWILGAWLGDGHSAAGRITAPEQEIRDEITRAGWVLGLNSGKHAYTVYGIVHKLRDLRVLNDKHVPLAYKRASVSQRQALLQGLMDTDGHCDTRGRACFTNKSKKLASDVFDVAASLALKPRMASYTQRLPDGRPYLYWQVCFQAHAAIPVFRLNRKVSRSLTGRRHATQHRRVISVDTVPTQPVSCIQVDSLDGIYLIGKHLVPTHNSTIISFAGVIQEVMIDPELTVAYLCNSKGLSIKLLGQVKTEFENNQELKETYPDVLWQNPKIDAPRHGGTWAANRIDLKRETNPKEGTIEAHGLTDGQPVGSHFGLRVYDDAVTRESTTSPEMVNKTTECWELSDNLKSPHCRRRWHIGTRYHFRDTYGEIIDRNILKLRIYPATDDGTPTGNPVFLTKDLWAETKITQRITLSAQMLQNPSAGDEAMFIKEELRFTDIRPTTLNVYIMVDPASSKKKGSDRTAMVALGVDSARNKYLLDGYCHKMDLQERWTAMTGLRKHWLRQPGVQIVEVGYERFGMRSDIEYFDEKMESTKDSFEIKELNWPQDSPAAKIDRIQRLVPDFGHTKFYLIADNRRETEPGKFEAFETAKQTECRKHGEAYRILKPIKRRDHEGNLYGLNKMFLDEYLVYPFSKNDDFLDCVSRIYDMDYVTPQIVDERDMEPQDWSE